MLDRYREIQRQKAAGEREDGFTLIELLIVIVVMGILAAVVVFALGGVTGSSAVSACKSDARSVETAVAAYQAQAVTGAAAPSSANLVPTYLKSFPSNPGHYWIDIAKAGSTPVVGEVDVAASSATTEPATGNAAWIPFDTESSAAGCNAVS